LRSRRGAKFDNTLTLGRLNPIISPWEPRALLDEGSLADQFNAVLADELVDAEPLFQLLSANNVGCLRSKPARVVVAKTRASRETQKH
jgi:hypothetical protein